MPKSLVKKFRKKVNYLGMKLFPRAYFPTYWIGNALKNVYGDVVQIGSNDGKADDPLHGLLIKQDKWRVFFVEAVDYIMQNLQRNYANISHVNFCNLAINDGKEETFYYLDPSIIKTHPNLPPHFDKLGSFIKENITKHLGDFVSPFIVEKKVKGMSLLDFFNANKINNLILLHTDTEGYDWVILQQLNFEKVMPKVILFEHKHLSKNQKNEAFQFFSTHYNMYRFGQDVLCLLPELTQKFNALDLRILSKKRLHSTSGF